MIPVMAWEWLYRAILTTALILVGGAVTAQMACAPRDELAAELARDYHETPRGSGIMADGSALMEIYAAETGSWTVIITRPDGLACVVATGDGWSAVEPSRRS